MSILPIVLWPDMGLRASCVAIGDADVSGLVRDMFETMYSAPGRGLAAPQVGVSRRVFVMDCTWKEGAATPVACIDPVIISASEERDVADEGCLSVPGVLVLVERPVAVVLQYCDVAGALHQDALDGFAARCAQHELDHLNGVLHFDHVSAEVRAQVMAEYGK